jgi:hypothetical protein
MQNFWLKIILWISLGCNVLFLGGLAYQKREMVDLNKHLLSRALRQVEDKTSENSIKMYEKFEEVVGRLSEQVKAQEAQLENWQKKFAHTAKEVASETKSRAENAAHYAKDATHNAQERLKSAAKDAYADLTEDRS